MFSSNSFLCNVEIGMESTEFVNTAMIGIHAINYKIQFVMYTAKNCFQKMRVGCGYVAAMVGYRKASMQHDKDWASIKKTTNLRFSSSSGVNLLELESENSASKIAILAASNERSGVVFQLLVTDDVYHLIIRFLTFHNLKPLS